MTAATSGPVVIVGGGAAGYACAEAYREAGGTAPVTIVSKDDRPPYFRPDLSKEVLAGDKESADELAEASWFADHDVDLRLATTARRIDAETRSITVAANGAGDEVEELPWASCLLAPGSSASSLPVPGGDDERLLTVRTAADIERIITTVGGSGTVVIVGSGFIGCEAASSLRARGVDVTMVSMELQPQQDRLSDVVGSLIAGFLADAGVDFHGGLTVESFEFTSGSAGVLAGGRRFEGDHILVASGARTNTEVATASGLELTNGGVHVDSSMRSAIGGLFVAGDLAYADNAAAGRPLRVEHWDDAQTMGKIAGQVMAGKPAAWDGVPGFWSTINGETLQYVAWGDGWDEIATRRSTAGLSVWYAKHGTIVGLLTHRHDDDQSLGKRLIAAGAALSDLSL